MWKLFLVFPIIHYGKIFISQYGGGAEIYILLNKWARCIEKNASFANGNVRDAPFDFQVHQSWYAKDTPLLEDGINEKEIMRIRIGLVDFEKAYR